MRRYVTRTGGLRRSCGWVDGSRVVAQDAQTTGLQRHLDRHSRWRCAAASMLPSRRVGPRHSLELVSRRDADVIEQALLLGLDVDEPKAIGVLRRLALDPKTPLEERSRMLAALVERRVPKLADGPSGSDRGRAELRGLALRSLAAYDDPATPAIILRHFAEYSPAEREDAIATLAARPSWAMALLEALGARSDSPA